MVTGGRIEAGTRRGGADRGGCAHFTRCSGATMLRLISMAGRDRAAGAPVVRRGRRRCAYIRPSHPFDAHCMALTVQLTPRSDAGGADRWRERLRPSRCHPGGGPPRSREGGVGRGARVALCSREQPYGGEAWTAQPAGGGDARAHTGGYTAGQPECGLAAGSGAAAAPATHCVAAESAP